MAEEADEAEEDEVEEDERLDDEDIWHAARAVAMRRMKILGVRMTAIV